MTIFEAGLLAGVFYIGWGLAGVAGVLKAIVWELSNSRWERTQLARLRLKKGGEGFASGRR